MEELTEAQIKIADESIERVIKNVQAGRPEGSVAAPVDEYVLENQKLDVLKNRHLDSSGHWRQVMEFWGFTWVEPRQLDKLIGPRKYIPSSLSPQANELIHDQFGRSIPNTHFYWTKPHSEGQWRSDIGTRRPSKEFMGTSKALAFTMADLISGFGEPAKFDDWAKLRVLQYKQRLAGLRRRG